VQPPEARGAEIQWCFTYAARLAQFLRLGLVPESCIYPAEGRKVHQLARKRVRLVQCRTAQIRAIDSLFARQTGAQMRGPAVKRLDGSQVAPIRFYTRPHNPGRP
jgi:hypothetical protein